ncbi:MAG: hypothetical protein CMK09_07885 [Ponticaulis sp.]|nr:hypothetical protein [Ponticaulis sp.]|tara:strand:- start:19128 stop:19868 length:741 start_codon:yes stop_codon:yes gene_type:complete
MRLLLLSAASLIVAQPAISQDAGGWSGEGAFSASTSTGNTETSQLGLGLNLNYKTGRWIYGVNASADYGETDGTETQNRYLFGGKADVQLGDKLFGFGQGSYESDEFSGFESRIFVGGGLGYHIFESETLKWNVRGGPGFKIDEVRPVMANGMLVTPGETVESFSAIGNSDFAFNFNDNVGLTNVTTGLYAEESTQLTNTTALTATLTNALSARMSFDVRHDTNPPMGFESTDTVTKASLVYNFNQ